MKHAVIGADGQIGKLLTQELIAQHKQVVAISRQWNGQPFGPHIEYRTADAMDAKSIKEAIDDCSVVYSVLGLPYNTKIWQKLWLTMTKNVLTAVQQVGCRLIYFDNVYAYGLVRGPMTENTPYKPTAQKGEVRARAAQLLHKAMEAGEAKIIIARSADFIGPGAASSIVGERFFKSIVSSNAAVRQAEWLGDPHTKHCYNFSLDTVKALVLLGEATNGTYGQIWHLPTTEPITGYELCKLIGNQAHCTIKPRAIRSWMLKIAGLFTPMAREQAEMQYQVENDYLFSDAKFMQAFPIFKKTSWVEIIKKSLQQYQK